MADAASGIRTRLPSINRLDRLDRSTLRQDLVAGLLLSAFLVPVGMAYAQASGLAPVYGLYATVAPMVAYALIGPSRLLVLAPDSSLAPLVAATVLPLAGGDPGRAATVAAGLAIGTGLLSVLAGLAGMGLLTELLSLPVRQGYLAGVAVVVAVGQLAHLLGIETEGDTLDTAVDIATGLVGGRADPATALLGLGSLVSLAALTRLGWPLAAVAGTVAAAGATTWLLDLDDRVAVVGSLPPGVPLPSVPSLGDGDLGALAVGSVGIALIAFADTSVLSQAYATREARRVDPDRELIALGVANLACGLFQGFPVSGSSSRTPVAESAGGRSQATGLFGAAGVMVLLVAAPALLSTLPVATLAAVLIVAVSRLISGPELLHLARTRPRELGLGAVCTVGVVVAGALWGIGLAVAMSVLAFLHRAWRPHTATLVRIDGRKGYHDRERHPGGKQVPGLLLYRFDAPLFFANAEVFRLDVLEVIEAAGPGLVRVVITAEPITDIDATADRMLLELHRELAGRGIELHFAELKGVVRDQLVRSGTATILGAVFHSTVGQAVREHVQAHGIDWVDWDEQEPEG